MTIDVDRLLRHMSWANRQIFEAVQALPDEALACYLVDAEFDVARILQHIVEGASWYAYCLCDNPDPPRLRPSTASDVALLAAQLAELEALLLREHLLDDAVVTFNDEYGAHTAQRSTIISQAVHHATEHRTQLVDALAHHGIRSIDLDELDLWAFEMSERTDAPSS